MQRDDTANAPATLETAVLTDDTKPSITLEELVPDQTPDLVAEALAEPARDARRSPAREGVPALRTARIVALEGRTARVTVRGERDEIEAALAPEVERDLIEDAAAHKDSVLVEVEADGTTVVVGVVQTRRPREVHVKGEKIVIEAEREVLLRAGRAALRLREDGDIELVGSRISAASRGLFRIVGRILRLN